MKKKIGIFISGLGLGGAEKLIESMIIHHNHDLFEIHVIYYRKDRNILERSISASGATCKALNVYSKYDPRLIFSLMLYLKRHNIEILHTHLPLPGIFGRIASLFLKLSLIHTEHNDLGVLHPVTRILNKATLHMNKCVVAVSNQVADSMGRVKKKIIIENGVDYELILKNQLPKNYLQKQLKLPKNTVVYGNVANITPKKNHKLLIKSFSLVSKENPLAILVIIGQDIYGLKKELMRYAKENNIDRKVFFLGGLNNASDYLRNFDFFVLSSDFEGLPISILEAMSVYTPVISTNVGGISKLIKKNYNGILVEANNHKELANAMISVANSPLIKRNMIKNAYQCISKNYSIKKNVKKVEKIYLNL